MRKGQVLLTYLHLAAARSAPTRCSHRGSPRSPTRRAAARRFAAAARPDVRGRRRHGAPGRRPPSAARRRRPRRADGRRLRRRRGQGRGHRAGVSGMNAAAIALGMQAEVPLVDTTWPGCAARTPSTRVTARPSRPTLAIERVIDADLVIGAVLVPGARAPRLVSNELVSRMRPARCWWTSPSTRAAASRTHADHARDPTYEVHNSLFYCVANMPGAVPHTSTYALTNVDPAVRVEIAEPGLAGRAARGPGVALGLDTPTASSPTTASARRSASWSRWRRCSS